MIASLNEVTKIHSGIKYHHKFSLCASKIFLKKFSPSIKKSKTSIEKRSDTEIENINKFLHSIEKISRNKILVAQHPKDDENLEKLIGFKCFKNKTSELVKNSEFVLCFDSISFQYAILSKKPIIFLTSEYLAPLVKRDILTISDFFKKDPIAIEDKISSTKFKKSLLFKLSIYKKYIKLFLSNTDKKKQNKKRSKIISDYIEKFY